MTVEDLILKLMEGKPADAGEIMDSILKEKIRDKIEERKKEIAENLLADEGDEEDDDFEIDDDDDFNDEELEDIDFEDDEEDDE